VEEGWIVRVLVRFVLGSEERREGPGRDGLIYVCG
jgi:hypothetical protein